MRMSAQFDPVTSRRSLSDTSWNQALLPMLGRFWRAVILTRSRRIPATVWANFLLHTWTRLASHSSMRQPNGSGGHGHLPDRGGGPHRSDRLPLARMAFEAQELEGLVQSRDSAPM